MQRMGSRSANELLQLPVRLHGIRLGTPVDLLLDSSEWRALGFVVLCGDGSLRFLVFAAGDLREDAIEVVSAFLLLEDLEFYRARSRSFRGLLGEVRDVLLRADGTVEALVMDGEDGTPELRPPGTTVEAEHVSPA
jgi:hypothetical protein